MRKRPFTEKLLSLYAQNCERGAALYGDLEELATTRGRLWFWWTYVRTLIALPNWRTGYSAFVLAYLIARSSWLNRALFSWMRWNFRWLPLAGPHFHVALWYLNFANLLVGLIFLVPFVAVRYGVHDRVTRLALATFLCSLPLFSLHRWGSVMTFGVIGVAAVAALCLRQWRRPAVVLVLTLAVRLIAMRLPFVLIQVRHRAVPGPLMTLMLFAQYPAAAVACLYLHRQLMEQGSSNNGIQVRLAE